MHSPASSQASNVNHSNPLLSPVSEIALRYRTLSVSKRTTKCEREWVADDSTTRPPLVSYPVAFTQSPLQRRKVATPSPHRREKHLTRKCRDLIQRGGEDKENSGSFGNTCNEDKPAKKRKSRDRGFCSLSQSTSSLPFAKISHGEEVEVLGKWDFFDFHATRTTQKNKQSRASLQSTPSAAWRSEDHPTGEDAMSLSDGLMWATSERNCKLPLATSSFDPKVITAQTLAELLRGDSSFASLYDQIRIIDCRFSYEFVGGHIQGAENISCPNALRNRFAHEPSISGDRIALIFHCEFSSERGPRLYTYLRSWDRKVHERTYPELYYPEMYILAGGYKEFFSSFPELCDPQDYIPMRDKRFMTEMIKGMKSVKRKVARDRPLSRAKSWCVNGDEDEASPFLLMKKPPQEKNKDARTMSFDSLEAMDDLEVLSSSPKRSWTQSGPELAASPLVFPLKSIARCKSEASIDGTEESFPDLVMRNATCGPFISLSSSSDEEEQEEEEAMSDAREEGRQRFF